MHWHTDPTILLSVIAGHLTFPVCFRYSVLFSLNYKHASLLYFLTYTKLPPLRVLVLAVLWAWNAPYFPSPSHSNGYQLSFQGTFQISPVQRGLSWTAYLEYVPFSSFFFFFKFPLKHLQSITVHNYFSFVLVSLLFLPKGQGLCLPCLWFFISVPWFFISIPTHRRYWISVVEWVNESMRL